MDRYAHALYCDDIRQEIGGKTSYIGAYRSDLVVAGEPPAIRPQLCVGVWIASSTNDPIKRATIRILHDDEEVALLETGELEPSKGTIDEKNILVVGAQITISPFVIQKEGKLRTLVQTEREELKTGALLLRFARPMEASEA